jgi:hypothetical protein
VRLPLNSMTSARYAAVFALSALLVALTPNSYAADNSVHVQLDVKQAGPRAVEDLTQRAILRDYRFAWASMARALESNSPSLVEAAFAGDAKALLGQTIASQQQSHLSQRYAEQSHQVEAVFYAPEGDVMELHDTAQYQLQILDGDKTIQDEHVTVHYIVLMTPTADRWVVRQLQAVPQF